MSPEFILVVQFSVPVYGYEASSSLVLGTLLQVKVMADNDFKQAGHGQGECA